MCICPAFRRIPRCLFCCRVVEILVAVLVFIPLPITNCIYTVLFDPVILVIPIVALEAGVVAGVVVRPVVRTVLGVPVSRRIPLRRFVALPVWFENFVSLNEKISWAMFR